MPVYEFYCSDCHRIFHFLSRTVNTGKRPDCPRCGRSGLERQVSLFAVSMGRREKDGPPLPDLDEARMERAMMALAGEAEGMDGKDPRHAARLMRKLYDSTGLSLGPGTEEMIRRMESGEDPDRIEEEMGDVLEEEDPFLRRTGKGIKGLGRRLRPPEVDDDLYEL